MSPQARATRPLPAPGWAADSSILQLCARAPRLSLIVIGGSLAVQGTTSSRPKRLWEDPYIRETRSTAAGPSSVELLDILQPHPSDDREATRRAISELRRLSGLTWEQIAELFEVSRRSVHFWASGSALNAANEARLMRVLQVIREADRGNARATRNALMTAIEGMVPFDLLVAQRFDEAQRLLGPGAGRKGRVARTTLSPAAAERRRPLPPADLVDASHESIHHSVGKARPVRTLRSIQRERDG